ncbi:hypothetical protein [Sinosporangium siamense]|uniref:Uncharacterized protein n=1 Tax=Sinosporangium siamense TaxID=1367973 RepID=A0A919RJ62_9ACTN|nr:hypothetical protein [Sinosporangium siamense]GII93785.1 hypothetical protein Ssi02_40160 [Sinosporangium siamense]
MRHFIGFLIGLVVTAALLVGGGWSVSEIANAVPATGPTDSDRLWTGLGVMAAVGLVLGIVAIGPISPLASFVPSIVLLSWTVVFALDTPRALSIIPRDSSLHEVLLTAGVGNLALLRTGLFGLLGVLLFVPVLLPSRWAPRHADGEDDDESESGYY